MLGNSLSMEISTRVEVVILLSSSGTSTLLPHSSAFRRDDNLKKKKTKTKVTPLPDTTNVLPFSS